MVIAFVTTDCPNNTNAIDILLDHVSCLPEPTPTHLKPADTSHNGIIRRNQED